MNFISNISNFYFVFLSLYSWRKKSVASNISLCDIGIDPFFFHSKYRQIKDNDKDISNANDRTKIHDSRIILFSFYYFCCAQASACWAFETIFEQCQSSAEWRAREKSKQTFIVRPHSVWTDSHQHFFFPKYECSQQWLLGIILIIVNNFPHNSRLQYWQFVQVGRSRPLVQVVLQLQTLSNFE